MELTRCFVAIEISNDLKIKIDDFILSLKQFAPKIKWVKANSLHITLKFLGEISQDLLTQVQNELFAVSNVVNPFEMSISGAGFFPNQNKPRVVWLGLVNENNNSIFKLHEWIDKRLESLGFEREKRRFSPHLTLGRIKFPDNFHDLSEYINQNKFHSSRFNVTQVVLMKSVLNPIGAEYSQIKSYPFEV